MELLTSSVSGIVEEIQPSTRAIRLSRISQLVHISTALVLARAWAASSRILSRYSSHRTRVIQDRQRSEIGAMTRLQGGKYLYVRQSEHFAADGKYRRSGYISDCV